MGTCQAKLDLPGDVMLEINNCVKGNEVSEACQKLMVLNQNRHMYDKTGQRQIRYKMNEIGQMLERKCNVPNPDSHFRREVQSTIIETVSPCAAQNVERPEPEPSPTIKVSLNLA